MNGLKEYEPDVNGNMIEVECGSYYRIDEADETIAKLKDRCRMHDFFWDGCGFAKRGFKNTIAVSEAFDNLEAKNRELNRALWLLKAKYFLVLMGYASDLSQVANPSIIHKSNFLQNPTPLCMEEYQHEAELYNNARIKCLKKAEEYNL